MVTCVDTFAPTVDDLASMLDVPQGTGLVVEGTAKTVRCWIARFESMDDIITTLETEDGRRATLGQPPGRYVIHCDARWRQGRVPFDFGTRIVPGDG